MRRNLLQFLALLLLLADLYAGLWLYHTLQIR